MDDACLALHDLNLAIGAPHGLGAIGMPEAGIARAVELALANPYWNPRPPEAAGLRSLLERAWQGTAPAVAA